MAESIVHWTGLEGLEPELRRYLRRRCRDASEADDVVQETLLRAARYRPGLVEPQRIHGWIQRIAANVLRDQRRREGRQGRVELDGWRGLDRLQGRELAPGDAEQEAYVRVEGLALERGMLLEHLASVLGMLRDGDRRVLSCYYDGEGSSARAAPRARDRPPPGQGPTLSGATAALAHAASAARRGRGGGLFRVNAMDVALAALAAAGIAIPRSAARAEAQLEQEPSPGPKPGEPATAPPPSPAPLTGGCRAWRGRPSRCATPRRRLGPCGARAAASAGACARRRRRPTGPCASTSPMHAQRVPRPPSGPGSCGAPGRRTSARARSSRRSAPSSRRVPSRRARRSRSVTSSAARATSKAPWRRTPGSSSTCPRRAIAEPKRRSPPAACTPRWARATWRAACGSASRARATNPCLCIAAFDLLARDLIAHGDLEGAAGTLELCRSELAGAAGESTELGERVRAALTDMRAIEELEEAVRRRRDGVLIDGRAAKDAAMDAAKNAE